MVSRWTCVICKLVRSYDLVGCQVRHLVISSAIHWLSIQVSQSICLLYLTVLQSVSLSVFCSGWCSGSKLRAKAAVKLVIHPSLQPGSESAGRCGEWLFQFRLPPAECKSVSQSSSLPPSHSVSPPVSQPVGVDAGLLVSCSGRLVSPSGSHTVESAEEPLRGKALTRSAGCWFE